MNAKVYRKAIRRRIIIMTAISIAYVVIMLATHMLWGTRWSGTEDQAWNGVAEGFASGAMTAVVACFVLMIPRYASALRDERALHRLWNREHDERTRAIKARAGMPMLIYTSLAMIAVAMLIGPWNTVAAMTLLFAATAQLIVGAVTKLICMRVM